MTETAAANRLADSVYAAEQKIAAEDMEMAIADGVAVMAAVSMGAGRTGAVEAETEFVAADKKAESGGSEMGVAAHTKAAAAGDEDSAGCNRESGSAAHIH